MPNPFLSLIIPAYNEEQRLPNTLQQVADFLDLQAYSAEVIVVENGSQDNTYPLAAEFARRDARFRVIREEQRGKGRAVQTGMLAASGEYRFMADADLSMPLAQINRFFPPALADFDVAIASREAPGAVRYDEPDYRHVGGRAINMIIRLLALPGLHDTQCGFKCFRADVAADLFGCQTVPGWAFDVEVLFVARQRGYRVVELPIPWYFNADSKISALPDALRMSLDIVRIRWNALRGRYNCGARTYPSVSQPAGPKKG